MNHISLYCKSFKRGYIWAYIKNVPKKRKNFPKKVKNFPTKNFPQKKENRPQK